MKRTISATTLLELLMMIVIIGILAAVALPTFNPAQENAYDKEATGTLKRMREAEMNYKMELSTYYPAAASESNITNINQSLKLMIYSGANPTWNYYAFSTGCVCARRNGSNARRWFLTINDVDGEPNVGVNCPALCT